MIESKLTPIEKEKRLDLLRALNEQISESGISVEDDDATEELQEYAHEFKEANYKCPTRGYFGKTLKKVLGSEQ